MRFRLEKLQRGAIHPALVFCALFWLSLLLGTMWVVGLERFWQGLQTLIFGRGNLDECLVWAFVVTFPVWPLLAEYAMRDKPLPDTKPVNPVFGFNNPAPIKMRIRPDNAGDVRKGLILLGWWLLIAIVLFLWVFSLVVLILHHVQVDTQLQYIQMGRKPHDQLTLWQLCKMILSMESFWQRYWRDPRAFFLPVLLTTPFWGVLHNWWRRDDTLTIDAEGVAYQCARTPKKSWRVAWNEIRLPLLYHQPSSRLMGGFDNKQLFIETNDKRLFLLNNRYNAWQPVPSPGMPEVREHFPALREIERWMRQTHPGKEVTQKVGMFKANWILTPRAQQTLKTKPALK